MEDTEGGPGDWNQRGPPETARRAASLTPPGPGCRPPGSRLCACGTSCPPPAAPLGPRPSAPPPGGPRGQRAEGWGRPGWPGGGGGRGGGAHLEVPQQVLGDVACVDADLDGSVELGHSFLRCLRPAPCQVLLRQEELERDPAQPEQGDPAPAAPPPSTPPTPVWEASRDLTWAARSAQQVGCGSCRVRLPTPIRTRFLATSAPRPCRPDSRTRPSWSLCMAGKPSTYLRTERREGRGRELELRSQRPPPPSPPRASQLPGVQLLIQGLGGVGDTHPEAGPDGSRPAHSCQERPVPQPRPATFEIIIDSVRAGAEARAVPEPAGHSFPQLLCPHREIENESGTGG